MSVLNYLSGSNQYVGHHRFCERREKKGRAAVLDRAWDQVPTLSLVALTTSFPESFQTCSGSEEFAQIGFSMSQSVPKKEDRQVFPSPYLALPSGETPCQKFFKAA